MHKTLLRFIRIHVESCGPNLTKVSPRDLLSMMVAQGVGRRTTILHANMLPFGHVPHGGALSQPPRLKSQQMRSPLSVVERLPISSCGMFGFLLLFPLAFPLVVPLAVPLVLFCILLHCVQLLLQSLQPAADYAACPSRGHRAVS